MGFFARILKAFSGLGTFSDLNWSGWWSGASTSSGISVTPEKALACTAVLACCRILAEDVAKLPLCIYKSTKDGGKQEAKDHPLHKLLSVRPNSWQTRMDFIEQMMFGLVMHGNAYAVILRDKYGIEPAQLVPIRPERVTIMVAQDGDLFYQISRSSQHDIAVLRDQPLAVPSRDMLHIRSMCAGGLYGMGAFDRIRNAIGLSIAMEEHGASLFKNGARPSGVLEHPNVLSQDAADRLRRQWQDIYGGSANSGKTVVLEEGMKYQAMTMTSVDAELLASRKFQVEEVARVFRVPLHMLQMLDRSTFNNIESQTRAYFDQALTPYLERIEAAFDAAFRLPEQGLFVEFETWSLLRADIETRFKVYAKGRQWGLLSANECRLREGMNPLAADGDVMMAPVNMMPLDKWREGGWKDVKIPAESDGSGRKS